MKTVLASCCLILLVLWGFAECDSWRKDELIREQHTTILVQSAALDSAGAALTRAEAAIASATDALRWARQTITGDNPCDADPGLCDANGLLGAIEAVDEWCEQQGVLYVCSNVSRTLDPLQPGETVDDAVDDIKSRPEKRL